MKTEKRVIRKINENQYIVEGSINLDDLNDQLGLDIDSEHYESIGGLIIENLERLPDIGDSVTIGNCTLKVEKWMINVSTLFELQYIL